MKILLIGANGYIGARLFYDLQQKFHITGTYHQTPLSPLFQKVDITQEQQVRALIKEIKPDIIIHAANNTDAKWCEENPKLARKINIDGTQHILTAAAEIQAKCIYISSFAAYGLAGVYSETKRAAEKNCQKLGRNQVILRASHTIGISPNRENPRWFNKLMKAFHSHQIIKQDISWHFKPTYIRHISEVIKKVIAKNIWDEIIPIAADKVVSKYRIAKDLLGLRDGRVESVDMNDNTSPNLQSLKKLSDLSLPQYTYEKIILEVGREIDSPESIVL